MFLFIPWQTLKLKDRYSTRSSNIFGCSTVRKLVSKLFLLNVNQRHLLRFFSLPRILDKKTINRSVKLHLEKRPNLNVDQKTSSTHISSFPSEFFSRVSLVVRSTIEGINEKYWIPPLKEKSLRNRRHRCLVIYGITISPCAHSTATFDRSSG